VSRLNVDVSQGLPLSSPPVSLTYRNRRVRYWTPAKFPRVMLPRWDGGYGAGRAVPADKVPAVGSERRRSPECAATGEMRRFQTFPPSPRNGGVRHGRDSCDR